MGYWLDAWNKVCGQHVNNDIKYVSKYPTLEFWSFYVSEVVGNKWLNNTTDVVDDIGSLVVVTLEVMRLWCNLLNLL